MPILVSFNSTLGKGYEIVDTLGPVDAPGVGSTEREAGEAAYNLFEEAVEACGGNAATNFNPGAVLPADTGYVCCASGVAVKFREI